jgi:hypothetical protein
MQLDFDSLLSVIVNAATKAVLNVIIEAWEKAKRHRKR